MTDVNHVLFARVENFEVDVDALLRHYQSFVRPVPATQYHDNGSHYEGWALTSRDGTAEDGVKQISRQSNIPTDKKRGTLPTPLCTGAVADVLEGLRCVGFDHFRARMMRMENEGGEMEFHRDAAKPAWRLHIPILTNPESFFEWQLDDGHIERVHMPADGSAWLVRVDVVHRAVNQSTQPSERVHLLTSLASHPQLAQLGQPRIEMRDAGPTPDVAVPASVRSDSRTESVGYGTKVATALGNAGSHDASAGRLCDRVDWATLQLQNRNQLLPYLPKGGVLAEVGVFKGGFSEKIFRTIEPQLLHLIDPWTHQDVPLWENKTTEFHWNCMRSVQTRFESAIQNRQVVLHQGFSAEVLALFPEDYFDWVYLDGDHRFDAVFQELRLCDTRVKADGLILGHDYIKPDLYPEHQRERFGVVPAVREFCATSDWEFVYQTPDQPRGSKQCPTFVLKRTNSRQQ